MSTSASGLFPANDSLLLGFDAQMPQQLQYGKSVHFDYGSGEFVMTPTGNMHILEGTDSWYEWCTKAINTERYRYLIYSRNHGMDYDDLIGLGLSRAAVESEIIRMTTETLMVNPRTQNVSDFTFSWQDAQVFFTCSISNERDEINTLQGSVVI